MAMVVVLVRTGEQLSRLMRHGSSPAWVNMSHSPHFTLLTLLKIYLSAQVKHPLAPAHCLLNNTGNASQSRDIVTDKMCVWPHTSH